MILHWDNYWSVLDNQNRSKINMKKPILQYWDNKPIKNKAIDEINPTIDHPPKNDRFQSWTVILWC